MIAAVYVQANNAIKARVSSSRSPLLPSVRSRTANLRTSQRVPTEYNPHTSGRNLLSRAGAIPCVWDRMEKMERQPENPNEFSVAQLLCRRQALRRLLHGSLLDVDGAISHCDEHDK